MYIAFDGIRGSGKSTQADLFAKRFSNVVRVQEPYGKIREILLNEKGLDKLATLYLFQAARVQLLEEVIRPALKDGKIVISDRFLASTFAYQGHFLGMVDEVSLLTTPFLPNLAFILDIPGSYGVKRQAGKVDNYSFSSEEMEKIRQGYLIYCNSRPFSIRINGDGTVDEVADRVWNRYNYFLGLKEKE